MKKSVSSADIYVVMFSLILVLVHRLVACLAFLLRLSPVYDSQLVPLLQVLQTKEALREKTRVVVKKPEIKQLVEEVAAKLCG